MIENTKCECGHQNYVGTVLCESCGKPLQDLGETAPIEMRYDGVVRRSQRKSRSIIDIVWRFFSSVKVAIYLILITLCTAVLGTVYPQENTFINLDPAMYYAENHGKLGEIYYMLGLSRTYESWWFLGLLFMIGTSLVVCSLDRVLPLYRALSRQQVRKHKLFLTRQNVTFSQTIFPSENDDHKGELDRQQEDWLEQIATYFKKRFYKVNVKDGALLAEKNRFSRWGPYINHIGLIIFLLAALMRTLIPGWHMDDYVSIMEGETVRLFDTGYYLKNERFTLEYYEEDEMSEGFREEGRLVPKLFETKAILYRCVAYCDDQTADEPVLEQLLEHDIQVNQPLNYEGVMAYQFDFEFTPQIRSVKAHLKDENGTDFGELLLDMNDPASEYNVGPYHVELLRYYPEFGYENGQPTTKSSEPRIPAFVFLIKGPDLEGGSAIHMYFPNPVDKQRFSQDEINKAAGSPFVIEAEGMEDVEFAMYTTFLNIRIDRGMPFVWVGAAISMLGLFMGSYWQHRRVWLRFDDGHLLLGAHTNKNWHGIRHDVSHVLAKMGIEVDPKSLSNEVSK